MDPYSFIFSKDVADYCKKIEYRLNPIEIAWLINKQHMMGRGMTIREKNVLFRELIETYPNMMFHESVKFYGGSSLHEYLKSLIEWNEACIEFLHSVPEKERNPFVYRIADGHLRLMEIENEKYKTFDDAFYTVKTYWNKMKNTFDQDYVRFFKEKRRTKMGYALIADVNINGEPIWFDVDNDLAQRSQMPVMGRYCPGKLDCLEVFLPIPFESGNIVDVNGRPAVLQRLPKRFLSGVTLRYYNKVADNPDFATFYYIHSKGELSCSYYLDTSIRSPFSTGWGYQTDSLQYYRGEQNEEYEYLSKIGKEIKSVGIQNFIDAGRTTVIRKTQKLSEMNIGELVRI